GFLFVASITLGVGAYGRRLQRCADQRDNAGHVAADARHEFADLLSVLPRSGAEDARLGRSWTNCERRGKTRTGSDGWTVRLCSQQGGRGVADAQSVRGTGRREHLGERCRPVNYGHTCQPPSHAQGQLRQVAEGAGGRGDHRVSGLPAEFSLTRSPGSRVRPELMLGWEAWRAELSRFLP